MFTAKVRVAVFRRVVAPHTTVLVVPSLTKPAVDDFGEVTLKMDAQILHSKRVSVWVCGTIGVVSTLTGSFTGYPGQLSTPILQKRE